MEQRTKEIIAFVVGLVAGFVAGTLAVVGFYLRSGDQNNFRVTLVAALAAIVAAVSGNAWTMQRLSRRKRHRY